MYPFNPYGAPPPYYGPFPIPPQERLPPGMSVKKMLKMRKQLDEYINAEEKKKEKEFKPIKKWHEKEFKFLETVALLLLFGPPLGFMYLQLLKAVIPH